MASIAAFHIPNSEFKMIRFHYFNLCEIKKIGRVTVPHGTPACHVYSTDTDGMDELLAWGKEHGFVADWLQNSRGFFHFIAWGGLLRHCGEGVAYGVLRRDAAMARMGRPSKRGRPCCGEHKQRRAGYGKRKRK